MLAVLAGTLLVVRAWSARLGWGQRHQLALAAGAMATYAWHSFVERPMVAAPPVVDHLGDVVFTLAAAVLVIIAVRRVGVSRTRESPLRS